MAALASIPRPVENAKRARDPASPLLHVDVLLVVSTLVLAGIGVVMVFSATRGPGGPEDPVNTSYLHRQALFASAGVLAMVAAAAIDYRRLRDRSGVIYLAMLILLVGVLTPLGSESKGTQAWFQFGSFQVQPSEFCKLGLILALASYVARHEGEMGLRHLMGALTLASVPMGLILLQPDLGTVLVFGAVTFTVLLVGGARPRHIVFLALVGIFMAVAILNSDVLAEYQKARLTSFLNPQQDAQGTTFNQDQSQIAIAGGSFDGHGLYQGPQTRSGLVPEQQTDFIFTVVGEELGFVGAATVLGIFALLLWRVWRIAHLSKDLFGTLLCVGVMAMLLFQIFQSVGMATGIMPVTGIPLPLLSYGGSSVLTTFFAVGLVLNVHMRRFT